jgi:hypothetical protein
MLDYHEIGANAAVRICTALLPISDLIDREAERRRETILRQLQLAADGSDIDLRRDIKLAGLRLAASNFQRLGEAGRDLVERFFAHALLPFPSVVTLHGIVLQSAWSGL